MATWLIVVTACAPPSAPAAASDWKEILRFPSADVSSVVIAVPEARMLISETISDSLEFHVKENSGLNITHELNPSGELHISFLDEAEQALAVPELKLSLPGDVATFITIDSGRITISSFSGNLRIETISAEINASGISGTAWLRSARGAISVRDSQGELHLLGQGRPVDIQNCHGHVAATTIMGEIRYSGLLGAGDRVQLESDHGGISLQLAADSSAVFTLASVNGPIQCTLPGLMGTGADCSAAYGGGAGQVAVRTVTGPIRISGME